MSDPALCSGLTMAGTCSYAGPDGARRCRNCGRPDGPTQRALDLLVPSEDDVAAFLRGLGIEPSRGWIEIVQLRDLLVAGRAYMQAMDRALAVVREGGRV